MGERTYRMREISAVKCVKKLSSIEELITMG